MSKSASQKKSSRVVAMLGRLAALAAVYAFFAILTPGSKGFMSDANTQLMLQDIAVVAMAAIGMTIVIIAGGIDLSWDAPVAGTYQAQWSQDLSVWQSLGSPSKATTPGQALAVVDPASTGAARFYRITKQTP